MKVFLDIDEVLADWEKGEKSVPFDRNTQPNEYWEWMGQEFYSNLPVIEGAVEFYKEILKILSTSKNYSLNFLTGVTMVTGAYSGKAEWVKKVFGDKFYLTKLIMCASKDKWLLAGSNRILIDDRPRNITEWNANGGIGILHRNFDESINQLKIIMDIKNEYRRYK